MDELDWIEARAACQAMGAELIVVETLGEHDWLGERIQEISG